MPFTVHGEPFGKLWAGPSVPLRKGLLGYERPFDILRAIGVNPFLKQRV